ncbi:DDE-type integrase/transposase/recombinase [Paenibacillus radicis (ex Xue et al. 2023)]|uniref:DDE-type integrase/transposase/recombinase n=1 Tax=Paenibacillus radicis (ex Xue et al. 2023) TaxID=2972489 RepID=A0ABT1YJ42_9BACL|nr:DDE-type integrase/transposase/recombinase [Paenibacillus radicis (ex Xue et al. 2023)]MCR8633205.1 DDE-type integrase/transposase/recombinase [Paenibacillus radicis (ex Xue et al. 2023)]
MKLHKLKENSDFHYEGRKYKVISITPPNVLAIKSGGDLEEEFNYFELISNHSFKSLDAIVKQAADKQEDKHKHSSILDTLSKKQRAVVSSRFEMIQPIILLEKAKSGNLRANVEFKERYNYYIQKNELISSITQEQLIKRISLVFGLSTRTIKRRLADFKREEHALPNEGITGLVPKTIKHNFTRKDYKILEICHPKKQDLVLDSIRVRLPEDCIPVIKGVIERDYLTLKKASAKEIFDTIESKCLLEDIAPPQYDTIYKILSRLNPELKIRMRDGKTGNEKFDEVQRGFSNKEAKYPLHIVEIDHTQLDIDVIDEKTGFVIGRPYISLGIDVFSRKIWCMEVSFEPPSADKVRRALMHGIFFKNAKQKYGTINEWDIYGIPSIIYLDNGPEFKNAEVKRMINETLQSQVQYRPVKTPRYGGTIERFIGTLNSELVHRLYGTRKGSVQEKGDYDSEKEAVFTLEDIRELLTVYFTDVYHHSVHKGLPIEYPTPATRYYAGLQMVGFPEWVDKEEEEHYRMELLPVLMKPYTRDGVRFENIIYRSADHNGLVRPREYKYRVKYDSDDVSKLFLQLPDTGEYIELNADRSLIEDLERMNRFTFKKVLDILREKGELNVGYIPGSREVKKGMALLMKRIQERVKSRRKAREQSVRMNLEMGIKVGQPPKTAQSKSKVTLQDMFRQLQQGGE